jgi:hypothetical protein
VTFKPEEVDAGDDGGMGLAVIFAGKFLTGQSSDPASLLICRQSESLSLPGAPVSELGALRGSAEREGKKGWVLIASAASVKPIRRKWFNRMEGA